MNPKPRAVRPEMHRSRRSGWLRAAVLGADDGAVSTASLMIGVAATSASRTNILIAGVAGLVAGAMSMAAGEYVSVSSQRDTEEADIEVEKGEHAANPVGEVHELAMLYSKRGLDPELAMKVAEQLSRHNPLAAHVRDELGLDEATRARPLQAAIVSALSFASAAVLPIAALLVSPDSMRTYLIGATTLVTLGALGALGARLGGAPVVRGALRVVVGGGLAMVVTAVLGKLLGIAGV
jgi:VIT1/CCC1 family predicted Fe2+/Mn2+ transporter